MASFHGWNRGHAGIGDIRHLCTNRRSVSEIVLIYKSRTPHCASTVGLFVFVGSEAPGKADGGTSLTREARDRGVACAGLHAHAVRDEAHGVEAGSGNHSGHLRINVASHQADRRAAGDSDGTNDARGECSGATLPQEGIARQGHHDAHWTCRMRRRVRLDVLRATTVQLPEQVFWHVALRDQLDRLQRCRPHLFRSGVSRLVDLDEVTPAGTRAEDQLCFAVVQGWGRRHDPHPRSRLECLVQAAEVVAACQRLLVQVWAQLLLSRDLELGCARVDLSNDIFVVGSTDPDECRILLLELDLIDGVHVDQQVERQQSASLR